MWLLNPSNMDSQEDITHSSELRSLCQPSSKLNMANFSYPRSDFIHFYHREQQGGRGSLGSDSSAPGMVEDLGSDLSVDEDCTGSDLWDSFWHVREPEGRRPDYPALIDSAVHQKSPMAQTDQSISPAQGPGSGSQHGRTVPCPRHRPRTPKHPPKACYSLFPIADVPDKRLPAPPSQPSHPRQPRIDPPPPVHGSLTTPNLRRACVDSRGKTMPKSNTPVSRPGSSRAATPMSGRGDSTAASSSESIPLLIRSHPNSPHSSPPVSPSDTCPSPRTPTYPSPSNLRAPALSKTKTRSSPSLAQLARSQGQTTTRGPPRKPPTSPDLNRPLPPLPVERPPSPPHISVFETDSDDEDDAEGGSRVGDAKNFARRFMHGLVHHHHNERRDKSPGADHKRSVSDEGPSTAKGRAGSSLSRAVLAARQKSTRAVVSMDLPRETRSQFQPLLGDESEKGGSSRLWMGKQSSDLFFGKILRRKG